MKLHLMCHRVPSNVFCGGKQFSIFNIQFKSKNSYGNFRIRQHLLVREVWMYVWIERLILYVIANAEVISLSLRVSARLVARLGTILHNFGFGHSYKCLFFLKLNSRFRSSISFSALFPQLPLKPFSSSFSLNTYGFKIVSAARKTVH